MVSSAVVVQGVASSVVFVGETDDGNYQWELAAGPDGAIVSGAPTGTLTVSWTPGEQGVITITVRLEDGAGLQSVESFDVEVVAPIGGALSVSEIATPTGNYVLSDNAADWMAFAHTNVGDVTQKPATSLITNFANFGNATVSRNAGAGSVPALSWAGGDSPVNAEGVTSALARWRGGDAETGSSFRLSSLSSATRTARVFFRLRAGETGKTVRVRFSAVFGGGVPVVCDLATSSTEHTSHCVEIVYKHVDAIPLDVRITHAGDDGAFFVRAIQVLGGGSGEASFVAAPSTWTVARGATFSATATLTGVSDVTGVSLSASGAPADAVFSASGAVGALRWANAAGAPNSYTINIEARRGADLLARLIKSLAVTPGVELPPVITAPATWALTVGVAAELEVSATSDSASAVLTLRADDLLGSSVFVSKPSTRPASGKAYWTPTSADITVSPRTVTVTATSANGQTSTRAVSVTVRAA